MISNWQGTMTDRDAAEKAGMNAPSTRGAVQSGNRFCGFRQLVTSWRDIYFFI
jgi:hypothetical protein